jgi:hypothetical protein
LVEQSKQTKYAYPTIAIASILMEVEDELLVCVFSLPLLYKEPPPIISIFFMYIHHLYFDHEEI